MHSGNILYFSAYPGIHYRTGSACLFYSKILHKDVLLLIGEQQNLQHRILEVQVLLPYFYSESYEFVLPQLH